MKLLIINGPNLNLLGTREPGVYGSATMDDCLRRVREAYPDHTIDYYQSNHEGDIIDRLHRATADGVEGIVLNAGAYTHTSLAIADAIAAITVPVVEVHISNVWKREPVRHHSMISPVCAGVIAGLGLKVYGLGIEALVN